MHKTPGSMPGVFVSACRVFWLLLAFAPALHAAECAPGGPLQAARVEFVIDGDTLALADGARVRLIGINAPETGHRDQPGEPFGAAAKKALAGLLPRGAMVYLQDGAEARDRYGRRLAHAFRNPDGDSIEARLLREGLAQQVAIPPNTDFAACLQDAERAARAAGRGIWPEPYFAPRDASALTAADAGYRRVRARIERVQRDRHGWWLETGGALTLRLNDGDARAFTSRPEQWAGKTLIVRGWVRDRSASKAVRERGYAPLLLPLQHPAMIESIR